MRHVVCQEPLTLLCADRYEQDDRFVMPLDWWKMGRMLPAEIVHA
jgi:hypothetical protein